MSWDQLRRWLRRNVLGLCVHMPDGPWVAEAWLEWDVCRGSVLYRERFNTMDDAARMAKGHARTLDYWLPRRDGMGINWGVRRACDADTGHAIWSPAMPGTRDYCGEHREAHPLRRQA